MSKIVTYRQLDQMDCGTTCLRMISKFYGRTFTSNFLSQYVTVGQNGVSMKSLNLAAQTIGFHASGVTLSFDQLVELNSFPCIAHWEKNHFIVIYEIKKKRKGQLIIKIGDPRFGLAHLSEVEFKTAWLNAVLNDGEAAGIALFLEPTEQFYKLGDAKSRTIFPFFQYLSPHKAQIIQVVACMFLGSIFQLATPFLSQIIIDQGIPLKATNLVTAIVAIQFLILASLSLSDFIRSWLSLHITSKFNLSLISDYLVRLMNCPIRYFEEKKLGDFLQRIGDHARIEQFVTRESLSILFSLANFVVFFVILLVSKPIVITIFLAGNLCYILISTYLIRLRKRLDSQRFQQAAEEQSSIIQLLTGIQEIKLNNCETRKRWIWERIQVKLFYTKVEMLKIIQYQRLSNLFFNHTTSLIISYILALDVINGSVSLGEMFSTSYIIGQLIGPIEQFIGFTQSFQDAHLSIERLNEIHDTPKDIQNNTIDCSTLKKATISLENVSFSYSINSESILKDISVDIPQGKVTAIVGASGGGKTTLLKILLGIYPPTEGRILFDGTPFHIEGTSSWRELTGAVLQDGYIFSDTILGNVTMQEPDQVNLERFNHAISIVNLGDFIESLPLGYNTPIGMEGNGISQGQRQRILIARVIYKNPDYIFFDEATNALDANNEALIGKNLRDFYQGKTVIVVAHRLSTIKNADKILVLSNGQIAESGTHSELIALKGEYYQLIHNQLQTI